MRYLFDTSVWIENFRKGDKALNAALEENSVVINDVIIGELSAGSIPRREQTISDLMQLNFVPIPSLDEMLTFISSNRLFALGLSWSDLQILASALLSESELITNDKKLKRTWGKISS